MDSIYKCTAEVFNNPIIVEQILKYAKQDLLDLKLRLVSKLFNVTCLKLIRKDHREINIEFNEKTDGIRGLLNNTLHVHHRLTKMREVPEYFRFLKNVAEVRVREIRIKNIWKLKPEISTDFHFHIHSKLIDRKYIKVLVGLEEVCDGCSECLEIISLCEEYGPIGVGMLMKLQRPIHFKKLIVTDGLLEHIASCCVLLPISKDVCYQLLNIIIRPFIACETFVLWISESTVFFHDELQFSITDHSFIPREVMELMLSKWNVESINVRLYWTPKIVVHLLQWLQVEYFTPVRLCDYSKLFDKSSQSFRHVTIDLTDSMYCSRAMLCRTPLLNYHIGYLNLLKNAIRLFPTDTISIKCLSARNSDIMDLIHAIHILPKLHPSENLSTLTINIEFFIQIRLLDYSCSASNLQHQEQLLPFLLPDELSINSSTIECYHREMEFIFFSGGSYLPVIKWIGRRLTANHKGDNCLLNVDLFINNDLLKEQLPEGFNFLHSLTSLFKPRSSLS